MLSHQIRPGGVGDFLARLFQGGSETKIIIYFLFFVFSSSSFYTLYLFSASCCKVPSVYTHTITLVVYIIRRMKWIKYPILFNYIHVYLKLKLKKLVGEIKNFRLLDVNFSLKENYPFQIKYLNNLDLSWYYSYYFVIDT